MSKMLNAVLSDDLAYEIRLKNQTAIRVMTAGTASVRGYTLVAAIAEEAAFWRVEGRDPGHEIIRSLRPGLATTRGPLFKISSPYSKQGFLWDSYKKNFGQEDSPTLVWCAPTKIMNPGIPQELIDRALADDRVSALCEYMAEFRSDISGLFDDATLLPLVVTDRRELAPQTGLRYFAFCDPSGGRQDAMTLALAHHDLEGRVILDLTRRAIPPFNPGQVAAEFAAACKEYSIWNIVGDKYAAEWVVAAFREHGIAYQNSENDRSQIYQEALPLFTRGQVELLDDPVLLGELRGLERRTRPTGRDMITHGPGGHDDLANSVCGALVLAQRQVSSRPEYQSIAKRRFGNVRGAIF